MLLIYLTAPSPRAIYIFHHIFSTHYRINYRICSDAAEFSAYEGEKFQYGEEKIPGNPYFFKSAGLLEEDKVFQITPLVKEELLYFSQNQQEFDPFAACFYLLSRYEEYLPSTTDSHGRYQPENSVLYSHGLLTSPMADWYAAMVAGKLQEWFPQITLHRPSPKAIITIDIDSAYAYLYKPWYRKLLLIAKSLFKKEPPTPVEVLTRKKHDPYDSYHYLIKTTENYHFKFYFFFLTSGWSRFDKNISPGSRGFHSLVRRLSAFGQIGIHPSYFSSDEPELIQNETETLSEILHRPVTASRQHYLRFSMPDTYQKLLRCGIKEDFSMGFANNSGFRAGTCSPFQWFDLEKNIATSLTLYPVSYLENGYSQYNRLSPEEAMEKIDKLIKLVHEYHGCFIPIWHNHTVNDYGVYKGWKQVFEYTLSRLKAMDYE